MNQNEFLRWEQTSRDIIDFKKIYVDIADGDVTAGLLLSDIIYWYLPNSEGKSKLRVFHEGKYWIARTRYEWWDRTRLSPKQADRVLTILEERKLIIKKLKKFNGAPTVHIRLNWPVFLQVLQEMVDNPPQNPYLPKGINQEKESISPEREIPIPSTVETQLAEKDRTLTENTTQTTSKNNHPSASRESSDNKPEISAGETSSDNSGPVGPGGPAVAGGCFREKSRDTSFHGDVETSVEAFVSNLFELPTLPKYAQKALSSSMWQNGLTKGNGLPSPQYAYVHNPAFRKWLLDDVYPWSQNPQGKPVLKKFIGGIRKGYDRYQRHLEAHSAPSTERFSDLGIPDGGFTVADDKWLRELENAQSDISD